MSSGLMIVKICTRFSMHSRFYNYSYREDFVADAITRCILKAVDKINLDLPNCNPFSYFTQTAYNIFRQKIKKEKKFACIKQKIYENMILEIKNDVARRLRPVRTNRITKIDTEPR